MLTIRTAGSRDWLMIYTASGKGRFGYYGGAIYTGPGEAVIMPMGLPHDYRIAENSDGWVAS